jgi:hypothetical protein
VIFEDLTTTELMTYMREGAQEDAIHATAL